MATNEAGSSGDLLYVKHQAKLFLFYHGGVVELVVGKGNTDNGNAVPDSLQQRVLPTIRDEGTNLAGRCKLLYITLCLFIFPFKLGISYSLKPMSNGDHIF
jgi:hypothetical protein